LTKVERLTAIRRLLGWAREKRRTRAKEFDTDPDKISRPTEFQRREERRGGEQQRSESQARDCNHDREGQQSSKRHQNGTPHAVARSVGNGKHVVRTERHVDGEAGGQKQPIVLE